MMIPGLPADIDVNSPEFLAALNDRLRRMGDSSSTGTTRLGGGWVNVPSGSGGAAAGSGISYAW